MKLQIPSNHSTLVITQVRSSIGRQAHQQLILRGLGLRGIRKTVQRPNTPQVRGLIEKIQHLVEVNSL
ncbi:MAG: 50S ribosomal protein L30 [Nitrospirales bacterium]|nr:50S ribosomal protein L30 [Nitrospirales bacterium]